MQRPAMTTQHRAPGPRRAPCCSLAPAVVPRLAHVASVPTGGLRSVAVSAAVFANSQSSAPATVVSSKERRQYVIEDAERLIRTDLGRIFATGDINEARYSKDVVFEDPLIRIQGLEQYKLYVQLLRSVFNVDFDVHSTAIITETEVEARWSMGMEFWLLPWKPYFVFTGRSIYEVDPDSGIILRHTDVWDALQRNAFLSMEGVQYVLQQLVQVQLTPSIQTPKYTVLQRFRTFEIRKYEPFLVAETPMSAGAGPASGVGFTELANYIFGGNQQQLKMEMTTPVFTTITPTHQGSTMQFVMESRYTDVANLPAPSTSDITTHSEQPAFVAVSRFSGWPLDFEVVRYERDLRDALLRDGFTPAAGYKLARYNEPTVPPMLRRNEVLINLANYSWPPAPTTAV